jgi:TfuA protein
MPKARSNYATIKRAAIFVGPSAMHIPSDNRWQVFPPASAGDLDTAVSKGFSEILFADALFFDANTTHLEILRAVKAGVRVFGVSSAGALRAVELSEYGMIGCGTMYDLYKRGYLTDDGELACALNMDDYSAISPPLVQIRYYLGCIQQNKIALKSMKEIFDTISQRYFMTRDVCFINEVIERFLGRARAKSLPTITDSIFDIKSIDLCCVLNRLAFSRGEALQTSALSRKINMKWLQTGLKL